MTRENGAGSVGRAFLDAKEFAKNAQRITNTASTVEGLQLYAPDALAEWITDGVYERYEGIDEIRPAVVAMYEVWRSRRLRVTKRPQCADADNVVVTYTGGFSGGVGLFGTEIWTFRDGLAIHHQMYSYLDVRPRTSAWAQARVVLNDPRTALRAKIVQRSRTRQSSC